MAKTKLFCPISQKLPAWTTQKGRPMPEVPYAVAGIVNVTPDSFSDGGKHFDASLAYDSIVQMIANGAHMIDIGAESTRPGAEDIGSVDEVTRLAPLFDKLESLPADCDACFTLDTFRAETARFALEKKAVTVINDVSGGFLDPAMVEVVGEYKPGYILGHCPAPPRTMQKAPHYDDVTDEVMQYFSTQLALFVKVGLPEDRIALDPCIGFAKTLEHNLQLIRDIPKLASLGFPLYFGISRKSLFKDLLGIALEDRDVYTQILTALLCAKGIRLHRVHNVPAAIRAVTLACAVL